MQNPSPLTSSCAMLMSCMESPLILLICLRSSEGRLFVAIVNKVCAKSIFHLYHYTTSNWTIRGGSSKLLQQLRLLIVPISPMNIHIILGMWCSQVGIKNFYTQMFIRWGTIVPAKAGGWISEVILDLHWRRLMTSWICSLIGDGVFHTNVGWCIPSNCDSDNTVFYLRTQLRILGTLNILGNHTSIRQFTTNTELSVEACQICISTGKT